MAKDGDSKCNRIARKYISALANKEFSNWGDCYEKSIGDLFSL